MILVLLDPGVGVLQGLGLKRRLSHEQSIQNASDGPDVNFVTVAFLAQDLGSDVVGGAAEGALSLAVEVDSGGKPKITNLDLE